MTNPENADVTSEVDPDGSAILRQVLIQTRASIETAKSNRLKENERRRARNMDPKKPVKEPLSYAIYFAQHFGSAIKEAFVPEFGRTNLESGEVESESAEGEKRVDVSYSTRQSGLGFMISLKSVHLGEKEAGNARFTHNLKRNDEELRVEATAFHLRQPYAVLVAAMILPFEACDDGWKHRGSGRRTSSFARWVEKFWTLKGRVEPEDPPNQFELVFIVLYARDGSELGFYEVGGGVACPRIGRPSALLSFQEFLARVKTCYYKRNQRDFSFEDGS